MTTARLAPNMFDLHPPFQIDGNFGAAVTKPESDVIALTSQAGRTYRLTGTGAPQPTYVRIANGTTGLVLDSGGNVASGSNLKQWNYDGSAHLQWQLADLGGGWYRVVNRANGMVIDSWGNTANGAVARQAAWGGSTNQQWRLNDVGNGTAGSTVAMWAPNGNTNNQWTITGV